MFYHLTELPDPLHECVKRELFLHPAYVNKQKQIYEVFTDGQVVDPSWMWFTDELVAWCEDTFFYEVTPHDLVFNFHVGDTFFFDWHTDYYDGQLPSLSAQTQQQYSILYYPHSHNSQLLLREKHGKIHPIDVVERRIVVYPSDIYHKVNIMDSETMRVSVPFTFFAQKELIQCIK